MKFTKKQIPTGEAWFSDCGNYKVVLYGDYWRAYFKPKGWANFGNSISRQPNGKLGKYNNRRAAQADCEKHFARFGPAAGEQQRIIV